MIFIAGFRAVVNQPINQSIDLFVQEKEGSMASISSVNTYMNTYGRPSYTE